MDGNSTMEEGGSCWRENIFFGAVERLFVMTAERGVGAS